MCESECGWISIGLANQRKCGLIYVNGFKCSVKNFNRVAMMSDRENININIQFLCAFDEVAIGNSQKRAKKSDFSFSSSPSITVSDAMIIGVWKGASNFYCSAHFSSSSSTHFNETVMLFVIFITDTAAPFSTRWKHQFCQFAQRTLRTRTNFLINTCVCELACAFLPVHAWACLFVRHCHWWQQNTCEN